MRATVREMVSATLYSDPACPWAYSEVPALRVLEWRYGSQLGWRLVLIGLTEDASQYEARGYTPLRGALGHLAFRRSHPRRICGRRLERRRRADPGRHGLERKPNTASIRRSMWALPGITSRLASSREP